MSWNPTEARKILDASPITSFVRSVDKISGFNFSSGRELALTEENKAKVSIYSSVAPHHMPDVVVEQEYLPTSSREGRHADIEAVVRSLGFSFKAYRLHIKSPEAMTKFINWYQYA